MAEPNESLDFSGLFKLDVLIHLDITAYSFYEVGLKKFLAFSSDKELMFIYINAQAERFEKRYDWDFVDNPVYCMCFEPSGTWVLIISEQKVLLVPFLPLFIPQHTFDCKWSLSSVTVLPLGTMARPTSIVWWLTKESENILIIGTKIGVITFYSLESQCVAGECKVSGEIVDLQICFDDSLDLLALLISRGKSQQWKLVLEHRSFGYNWLQQSRAQSDHKRDSFMSYIKQLSKDKITFFIQGGSKDDNKAQTVEHALKPTEYLPMFRKGSNNWSLTAQYVNGRHFLTAFELNEGTLILESPNEDTPSRTLKPYIKKDGLYIQGLCSQRLIYLLRKNELEVHSAKFSDIQENAVDDTLKVLKGALALLGLKRQFSELWRAEVIGDVRTAHLMSTKEPSSQGGGWREPTFMCDLQLPRFSLEPCLIVTNRGAYILNTVCDPCEWLVGLLMRASVDAELFAAVDAEQSMVAEPEQSVVADAEQSVVADAEQSVVADAEQSVVADPEQSAVADAEQSAVALSAPVPTLLRAAADMLMSRGKFEPAQRLYSLSRGQPDGWVARLGIFGRLQELSMYKHDSKKSSLGNAAIAIQLLAILLKLGTNREEKFEMDGKFMTLSTAELCDVTCFAAAIGLWNIAPMFSIHRGYPLFMYAAIKVRIGKCRGVINCLIQHKCIVPLLLEANQSWLFKFIVKKCKTFDTSLLKDLCLWLNPLQDQLRPIMRDMRQGISSVYTKRMLNLIETFIHVACTIESRHPCPDIHLEITQSSETWRYQFVPKRAISCGLAHWAVADEGNAKIFMTYTPINTEIIGRVVDIACGRHHTLVLTENGIYAAGDNTFGQLGVGSAWAGAIGDNASPSGALMLVAQEWDAPLLSVAAGHYHSAAIDLGGRLYTWGWGVHGQLGHGNIDDVWKPQIVTKFQGRKVLSVGCGTCHTVVLTRNGEVWACGAGVFGQLGTGGREKASLPLRVALPDTIEMIAVGYFHNLAVSAKGQLWTWGASPQQIRAAHARRSASPDSPTTTEPELPAEPHLLPHTVDIQNIRGRIVRIAAGWHCSFVINNVGSLYSWGLNFDGQLGSGDRKQVHIPTEVRIRTDPQSSDKTGNPKTPDVENKDMNTKAMVACGGDFTIFVDDDGRIYSTLNTKVNSEKEKDSARVIVMKTTKRVIKIPANRSNNKFMFQPIDRMDIIFPFELEELQRKNIEPRLNPLKSLQDFDKISWADDIILLLKPWINKEHLIKNYNMAAKLAYHSKSYSDCLRFLLDNLKVTSQDDCVYLAHTEITDKDLDKEINHSQMNDEPKIMITNFISKKIRDVSLAILNEEPYPDIEVETYNSLPCLCDELKYLSAKVPKSIVNITDSNLASKAATIIDKCISIFPVDTNLWEICFRLSKDFYIQNGLSFSELETVLRKYMESHATTMAAAIMYSKDCAQYSEVLTPKFYLNMCNQVLDTWG